MKFVVLGGAGAMGKVVVRDLFESCRNCAIVVADYHLPKARGYAKAFRSRRVKAAQADVNDVAQTARLLKGVDACLNCVQYELNLKAMQACLRADVHYLDLGGLFHVTRKQLKLHSQFKRKGLLAVLGMGAAPGVTNVLARIGAERLDRVREIHIRVGGKSLAPMETSAPLAFSYSPQTILEEHTYKPVVFTKGKFKEVAPRTGREEVRLPKPIGLVHAIYTLHSEVATLPLTFRKKGVKEVSFKIAFDPDFEEKISLLAQLGLASREPLELQGETVRPFDLLVKVLNALPKPKNLCPQDVEVLRAVVKGTRRGRKKTVIVDAFFRSNPEWCFGAGDLDTGVPPSIVAQMIAKGAIKERGVLAPEQCVPVKEFLKELRKRRVKLLVREKSGWGM